MLFRFKIFSLLACLAVPSPFIASHASAQEGEQASQQSIGAVEAVRLTEARWRGEIVSVELVPALPSETAAFVWSVRLLSEAGALILIRLDAETGDYLSASGVGLVEARRLPGED